MFSYVFRSRAIPLSNYSASDITSDTTRTKKRLVGSVKINKEREGQAETRYKNIERTPYFDGTIVAMQQTISGTSRYNFLEKHSSFGSERERIIVTISIQTSLDPQHAGTSTMILP